MSKIEDGIYTISVPMGSGCITDPGEGRWVPLMPHKSLGKDADKIRIKYNHERGAYTLQFQKSKKYLSYEGPPSEDNKLMDSHKARYFKIEQHPYGQWVIKIAENLYYHVGIATERIIPPWVAMTSHDEVQQWEIKKI